MRTSTVNYRKRDRHAESSWWPLVNVGFWLHGVPRPLWRCRWGGHVPVVDGYDSTVGAGRARWVMCRRCGLRGAPQGALDPDIHHLGEHYVDGFAPQRDLTKAERAVVDRLLKDCYHRPGPIPDRDTGTLGGQLVALGARHGGVGFNVKVGNGGSEHTLAADVHAGWLGSLYLWTSDGIGRGVQHRLNPVGWQSRVTGVRLQRGRLQWQVWANRDDRAGDPAWRSGELDLRIRDRLLGPRRYSYEDTAVHSRLVKLPEGDYLVKLTLQATTLGRKRLTRPKRSWTVDWSAQGKGLPTEGPERGRIFGSSVDVSGWAVRAGTWPAEAAAAIAADITRMRTGRGWDPLGTVPPITSEVNA
jgi:hypothetical protein